MIYENWVSQEQKCFKGKIIDLKTEILENRGEIKR